MTNRVQVFRTPTTGVAPAAGTRASGELWINLADFQLGMIDASRTAQKLVAVRFFVTTANYAAGDFVIQAGVLYAAKASIPAGAFNASQWTKVAAATDAGGPYLPIAGGTLTGALLLAADPGAALGAATKQYVDGKVTAAPYLPLAGGTMTGPVILSGPPTIPLHAATKAYVDSGAFVPIAGGTMTGPLILNADATAPLGAATLEQVNARGAGDNRIINGDMRIDQRNAGASGTTNSYTVDRWSYFGNVAGVVQWQRKGGAAQGFGYCLGFTALSTHTLAAADNFFIVQSLEADAVADFAWGTASAQPVTLSFWAQSSKTGTFGGVIQNYAATRSYPFSFSLLAASTWTYITVVIPGDTAGAWVMSGNAGSIYVYFDLGTGTTYRGPAGAWAAANFVGVTGAQSIVTTANATFNLTGVKLEVGSVATSYNRQSLAKSMADCQRYYQARTHTLASMGYAPAGTTWYNTIALSMMRATPTVNLANFTYANCSAGAASIIGQDWITVSASMTTATSGYFYYDYTASAEL